jgi:hypothetical protein
LLREGPEGGKSHRQSEHVQVFDWHRDVNSNDARMDTRDADAAKRIKSTLIRLSSSGANRPLARPPADWPERLQHMARTSPNFQAVIDTVVRPHLILASKGITHRMPPTLLVGKPGIAKTRFANGLQRVLCVSPPLTRSLASQMNGATLSGSSVHWSNAAPGALFELMAWGHCGPAIANPLIVLDEVDKAPSTDHAPIGARTICWRRTRQPGSSTKHCPTSSSTSAAPASC